MANRIVTDPDKKPADLDPALAELRERLGEAIELSRDLHAACIDATATLAELAAPKAEPPADRTAARALAGAAVRDLLAAVLANPVTRDRLATAASAVMLAVTSEDVAEGSDNVIRIGAR